ncbi:MAG: ATP-binding cassette domain-containing protein [Synergistaceae bacterium]|nr:ATP-binding cassette domain-containing protein [Synergistaceae bacterium]
MNRETQFILKGAEYSYPQASEKILKGIDLEIRAGEWVALLGSNGSGKSTLLKLLSALLTPTQGLCFIGGVNTAAAQPPRGFAAIVFQNPEDQIVAATVEEEVAFGPENLGCPREEIISRVQNSLRAAGLETGGEKLVSSLSGGQKQRLALAGALAMRPSALLLDEAMSMLDPQSRLDFTRVITEEHSKGLTIIQVTHRLEEIRGATRVLTLENGVISCDMPAAEFLGKSEKELAEMKLAKPPLEKVAEALIKEGLLPPRCGADIEKMSEILCR